MDKFLKRLREDSKYLLIIMTVFASIFMAFFIFSAGLVTLFFVGLIIWVIFVVVYLRVLFNISFVFRIFLFVVIVIVTAGLLYKAVPEKFGGKKTNNKSSVELVECTSSPDAPLQSVEGMTLDLYSGFLDEAKGSPEPETDSGIKSFSLSGINDKTETNSFYAKFYRKDGQSITGYDEIMEVCNTNNMGSSSYVTYKQTTQDIVSDTDISARFSYFHGGKYLLEAGDYRVDGYIFDKNSSKWVLVSRKTGITITE